MIIKDKCKFFAKAKHVVAKLDSLSKIYLQKNRGIGGDL